MNFKFAITFYKAATFSIKHILTVVAVVQLVNIHFVSHRITAQLKFVTLIQLFVYFISKPVI